MNTVTLHDRIKKRHVGCDMERERRPLLVFGDQAMAKLLALMYPYALDIFLSAPLDPITHF
jgi:hypothetical protein